MTTLMHWIMWCEHLTDEQYERMWPIIDEVSYCLTEEQEIHVNWTLYGWMD